MPAMDAPVRFLAHAKRNEDIVHGLAKLQHLHFGKGNDSTDPELNLLIAQPALVTPVPSKQIPAAKVYAAAQHVPRTKEANQSI